MGQDMHGFAERRRPDGSYEEVKSRDYWFYGRGAPYDFLTNIVWCPDGEAAPYGRGYPSDASRPKLVEFEEGYPTLGDYNHGWVTIEELEAFDYGQTVDGDLGPEAYASYLGSDFMDQVSQMRQDRVDRLVFWFTL